MLDQNGQVSFGITNQPSPPLSVHRDTELNIVMLYLGDTPGATRTHFDDGTYESAILECYLDQCSPRIFPRFLCQHPPSPSENG